MEEGDLETIEILADYNPDQSVVSQLSDEALQQVPTGPIICIASQHSQPHPHPRPDHRPSQSADSNSHISQSASVLASAKKKGSQGNGSANSDLMINIRSTIRCVDDYEQEHDKYYFPPAGLSAANKKTTTQVFKSAMKKERDVEDEGEVKEVLTGEEIKRKRITLAVGIVAGIIIVSSILLVAVTLNMTSKIDAIVKEQNDNLYAQLTSSRGEFELSWNNSSSSQQSFPILQYSSRNDER